MLEHVFRVFPHTERVAEEEAAEVEEEEKAEAEDGISVEPGTEGAEEEVPKLSKVAIIGRPNVGKSTLLNALTGTGRAIVSPIAGTTRDAVDELFERDGQTYRFIDTAGIRRKGKTELMAEKLSVVMARKHLEAADVALILIDAVEGVTASDATIAGYAHESGRSVIIVINKWDLVTTNRTDGKPPADAKLYEERARRHLKFLNYAPIVFVSASTGKGLNKLYSTLELVAKERRKRIGTGAMNRFLAKVDFERASVPMNKRVRIFYMTQAAVSPPTFILFTDREVKTALCLSAFPGEPDSRCLRIRRLSHLDQEPRPPRRPKQTLIGRRDGHGPTLQPPLQFPQRPLAHHGMPLLLVADSAARFFVQRLQQIERNVGRLETLTLGVADVIHQRAECRCPRRRHGSVPTAIAAACIPASKPVAIDSTYPSTPEICPANSTLGCCFICSVSRSSVGPLMYVLR